MIAETMNSNTIKTYIQLTKPGIIWGNCIAGTGGFMFAAQGNPQLSLYAFTMLGICLIVASGCVFNNIIDTDIDSLMTRTQKRALVIGKVSRKSALIYASMLGFLGFFCLLAFTNIAAFLLGVFGFYVYVVMYSVFYKRSSVHGTLIGSASGASPPVIGYLAVTGSPDMAALLIFLGFCAWQMPHSYAIALFRKQDYQASDIPLLPLVKGIKTAQRQMIVYMLLYWASIIALFAYGYIGYITLLALSAICVYWVYQAVALFKPEQDNFDVTKWGKQLFITSIFAVMLYSLFISLDVFLI